VKNIFLDSDIILDLLLQRYPHDISISLVFEKAKSNKLKLFTSSVCITNVYYILRKNRTNSEVKNMLNKLLVYVDILSVDSDIIRLALNSFFKDFEDAVQYYTSIKNNLDIILTRNIKDYKSTDIPVMTPDEFLGIR
jgi:predicted nucleic acid-binding protein